MLASATTRPNPTSEVAMSKSPQLSFEILDAPLTGDFLVCHVQQACQGNRQAMNRRRCCLLR
jgi:hypothetical protein